MSRVIEEVFPFVVWWMNRRKIEKRMECEPRNRQPTYAEYTALRPRELRLLLSQQHDRAMPVDDKTFRWAALVSIAAALLVLSFTTLRSSVESEEVRVLIVAGYAVVVFYLLGATYLMLEAMRTAVTHGYGTRFELGIRARKGKERRDFIALMLWKEEQMNLLRVLRNEATFQTLRNVLFMLAGIGLSGGITAVVERLTA